MPYSCENNIGNTNSKNKFYDCIYEVVTDKLKRHASGYERFILIFVKTVNDCTMVQLDCTGLSHLLILLVEGLQGSKRIVFNQLHDLWTWKRSCVEYYVVTNCIRQPVSICWPKPHYSKTIYEFMIATTKHLRDHVLRWNAVIIIAASTRRIITKPFLYSQHCCGIGIHRSRLRIQAASCLFCANVWLMTYVLQYILSTW